ncbi:pacearchaeosortase [Candidatus Woesearchaeota archaeon]|jgi:exosortase/archaeosortase family protein|nr:pacearchaeosortase [archaeon]MBT4631134.1 pacearchaeosortase [Candidatus Woesearchaeota archaeon]
MKNLDLPIRYVLAVLVGIFYQIFYWIFSPWTLHSTYWILNLVYDVVLEGNLISFDSVTFALIPACTAATAYLLLTMLILVTRGIKLLTRIKIWIYGCLLILVFNTLRIFLLIWIYVTFGQNYFDALHLMFWHVVSTVVVILIWIGLTKKYKVKGIPVYSDLKYILSFR